MRSLLAFVLACGLVAPRLASAAGGLGAKGVGTSAAERKLSAELAAVQADAKAKSARKDYAGAAELLARWIAAHAKVDESSQLLVNEAKAAERTYEQRAGLAAKPDDVASLRGLLATFVTGTIDAADATDPRVRELVASLKAKDPAAGKLFGPHSLRVTGTASAGFAPELAQLALDRAVESLRGFGYEASSQKGSETVGFTLSAHTNGDFGALLGGDSGLGGMVSCRFEMTGRWTNASDDVVCSLSLARTEVRLGAEDCYRTAAARAGDLAATEVIRAYLRANP